MPPKPIIQNTLFCGDNLQIMREHISSESVELVYIDPPFNSNWSYNALFKDESGKAAKTQITAFDDTWHWREAAEKAYHDLMIANPGKEDDMIAAMHKVWKNLCGNHNENSYHRRIG